MPQNGHTRVIQLAQDIRETNAENEFLNKLQKANSNISLLKNGKQLYLSDIKPEVITPVKVGVHYAISSLFKDYRSPADVYAYSVSTKGVDKREMGKHRLVTGQACIRSRITLEEEVVNFAVLHLSGHNLSAGVKKHHPLTG